MATYERLEVRWAKSNGNGHACPCEGYCGVRRYEESPVRDKPEILLGGEIRSGPGYKWCAPSLATAEMRRTV